MHRLLVRLFLGAALIVNADIALAKPDGFSCEQIKEKGVRNSCIKDREAKAQADAEEKARAASVEKENQAARDKELQEIAEKNRATDEFVNKSKQLLVQNLKDPDSAKFTNLVIAQNGNNKLLCGSINAKNSYGGYVGAKKFYVLWDDSKEKPEVYSEGDAAARANVRMDELLRIARSSSASIDTKMDAMEESRRLVKQAQAEEARSARILADQCNSPVSRLITVAER